MEDSRPRLSRQPRRLSSTDRCIRRTEAQRRIRHGEHIARFVGDEVDARGHARKELTLRVVDGDDHGVVHDVIGRRRLQAHLLHGSVEFTVRQCLNAEVHVLPLFDLRDVALTDLREDLHVRQIVRDHEKLRSREARRDRLPLLNIALDDRSVNR